MVSWLSNKKKIEIVKYIITSSNQTKKNNYNFCENKDQRDGKEITRVRGDCECEGKRSKKKEREKEKYYLHQELKLLTLGYTGWVRLSGFQKC